MQVVIITFILHSKEHVCCSFRVISTLHEYRHFCYKVSLDKDSPVVPNRGAIYNTQGAASYFLKNITLKILFSRCHQTLKQIAMRSLLGVTNYICLLKGAASLKWLGNSISPWSTVVASGRASGARPPIWNRCLPIWRCLVPQLLHTFNTVF